MSAMQFSSRWRQRRTVKRKRNRGSHHLEQNLYPSGLIQLLKCAHKIGKRTGQDTNMLPFDEAAIQARQIAIGLLDKRFHDTNGDGNWPTVRMCD